MLHRVIRASMSSARTALPRYSITYPVPPPAPSAAITAIDDRPALARLRGKMAPLGAAIEQLADEIFVATLAGQASATDQAAAAARAALARSASR
jgi:hypothetical protein